MAVTASQSAVTSLCQSELACFKIIFFYSCLKMG